MQQAVNFKVVKSFAIREHCVAVLCDECHPKIGLFRTTENEKLFNNSIPVLPDITFFSCFKCGFVVCFK